MTNKILFLDIDGPLLPGRACYLPGQTAPYWTIFDPVAVSLLNNACETTGRKIVVHSSWVKHMDKQDIPLRDHLVIQGVDPRHFHEDLLCQPISWRYDRIAEWLSRHPEVDNYVIVDDEPPATLDPQHFSAHLVLVDYMEGWTMAVHEKLKYGDWFKVASEPNV